VTKSELVQEVAVHSGVSRRAVSRVLSSLPERIVFAVKAGESVVLPGFGVFYGVKLKPKELFGEGKKSVLRRKIRFRQSRTLR
jgi:nucleoid DNA-binding protein